MELTEQITPEAGCETEAGEALSAESQLCLLQEQLRSHLITGSERLRGEEKFESAAVLRDELLYLAGHLQEAIRRGSESGTEALLRTAGYLGGETFELQWSLERANLGPANLEMEDVLDAGAHENWRHAVSLFDGGDIPGARAAFTALAATASFKPMASQYLGLLAMSEGDLREAVKHFETARRLAGSEQERAVACAHLGRAWFAAGDPMRAAKAALSAAEADPARARLWYEAAVYCARLEQPEYFSEFLTSAVRRDWVYWAIAAADPDLDPARDQVVALLDEIRAEQRRSARVQLDKLKNIINTLSETEARVDVLAALKLAHELEDQFKEGNFFTYMDLQNAAVRAQREVLQQALGAFDSRVRLLESAIAEQANRKPPTKTEQLRAIRREASGGQDAGFLPVIEIVVKIWAAIAMLATTYWAALAIVSSGRDQVRALASLKLWGLLLIVPAASVYGYAFATRKIKERRRGPAPLIEEPSAEEEQSARMAEELDRVQKLRDTLQEYLQSLEGC
ncbi:MAG: hypothetical protein SFV51_02620 [Bryobacteraceae bacterium]|nr:hypothetical protein [Bryobacteraceae bacterium]